ncbi:hypothetical protein KR067_011540 [Drosophila pandora]|nr:hypothetical protein KR067_011540 [Drosophila pandora]
MELEKKTTLTEAILKDLKAFKLHIKTKVFKLSDCSRLRQGIDNIRSDYDHWLAIFKGINDKLRPEIEIWERALGILSDMLVGDDLKVEVSDGGCGTYMKLTRELKDTVFLKVDHKEELETLSLPKAKVWIESKINSLKNSLALMEQDRAYVEEQKAKIYALEKCIDERVKKLCQNRGVTQKPIENMAIMAKCLDGREIQVMQNLSESQMPEPIEQKIKKIMENVHGEAKKIAQIKNTITYQIKRLSSLKTYGNDREINDLRLEIKELLVQFPKPNETDSSVPNDDQGVENAFEDKSILQDSNIIDNKLMDEENVSSDNKDFYENSELNDVNEAVNQTVNQTVNETVNVNETFHNTGNETLYYDAKECTECQDSDSGDRFQ